VGGGFSVRPYTRRASVSLGGEALYSLCLEAGPSRNHIGKYETKENKNKKK